MADSKKEVKKIGLIKALEKKYGKDETGRIVKIIKDKGTKGLSKKK